MDKTSTLKLAEIERPHSVRNPPVDDAPEFTDDDARQMYVMGLSAQLQRTYTQRCLSCANWTPAKLGIHGTCSAIGAKSTNDAISVSGEVTTHAIAFGCLLWSELDDDATHERTDLAIRRNLLEDMPENFDPGNPLKERMRERKQAVDGIAVAKRG